MGELLGVKRTTYANWEKNTVPEMSVMTKISELTKIPISHLMSINEETTEIEKSKGEILKELMQLKAANMAIIHVLAETVAIQRGVHQTEAVQMINQRMMKYLTDRLGE